MNLAQREFKLEFKSRDHNLLCPKHKVFVLEQVPRVAKRRMTGGWEIWFWGLARTKNQNANRTR